ncbi:MAG: type II/IV secretion system ATPase subunit [Thermoplasmata archaeon]|nr:type II/IV secretion system ATPase subunit [Thermoplasmata archaeon]
MSPQGVAFAFRRHSTDPWTLPRFVANKTMSPLAAGLLWFLVDGQATALIAGSRGAGKSSLLGSLLFALSRSQRILVIEDTLELPVDRLQELGYKAQSLKIGQGLTGRDALRVSLRLGEGALVLGEVRGDEARILYEAMRTGTAGSTVLGTFHADSPRAIYERVVHDLGIPYQSFASTDVVVISGLVRPGGGHRVRRRLTHVAEVDKHNEGIFRSLLEYDEAEDILDATDEFYYRSEVISSIARSWGFKMEEAIGNIHARASVVEKLVDHGERFISAPWVAEAFSAFTDLMQEETAGKGGDWSSLMDRWNEWFEVREKYG